MNKQIWGEKRYHSLDYYLKNKYGQKIYKLSLSGGMTCPNRDGTVGNGGCIFCSEKGSGDYATRGELPIWEQIEQAKLRIKRKTNGDKYIAYFQAFTNTYGSPEYLRKIFFEAINHPDIVILSIATRPDCLGPEILSLLGELNKIKPVWIELGLQTIHEETARFIRRGYPLSVFTEAVDRLSELDIDIIVHVIAGLPLEGEKELLSTVNYLSGLSIQGLKLQLLHVLKGTDLESCIDMVPDITRDEYVDMVIKCIEHIPPHMVIHRITGDAPRELLIKPLWSADKRVTLNEIERSFKERDTWQGKSIINL